MSDIEAAVKKVNSLGDIDLLVNNAGIALLDPFEEIKMGDFDKYVFKCFRPHEYCHSNLYESFDVFWLTGENKNYLLCIDFFFPPLSAYGNYK